MFPFLPYVRVRVWISFVPICSCDDNRMYRPFSGYKTDVLLIFSFITGDKTEFLSSMMFSNEYITEI